MPSLCFNTAGGRCCCNIAIVYSHIAELTVSIPQAVGVVATGIFPLIRYSYEEVSIPQAVGVVATKKYTPSI